MRVVPVDAIVQWYGVFVLVAFIWPELEDEAERPGWVRIAIIPRTRYCVIGMN